MKKTEYGIIGYPLGQSASPAFFNKKFADEGINAEYIPFEIESIDRLPRIIEEHPTLKGFNVTIPYKLQVMEYLEGLSPAAEDIQAVNVVKVERDADGTPHLFGHNSDVIGFTRSLEPLVKGKHTKALILGTGGVSKAVVFISMAGFSPARLLYLTRGVFRDTLVGMHSAEEYPGMSRYSLKVWEGSLINLAMSVFSF